MGVKLFGLKEIINDLRKVQGGLDHDLLTETTHKGYDIAKEFVSVHTKTGRMERNLTYRIRKNTGMIYFLNSGMLRNGVNYAVFVHYGTRKHVIKPKFKKALRWKKGGRFHFAKKVKHPGYKGDPFFDKTIQKLGLKAESIFDKYINKLFKDW